LLCLCNEYPGLSRVGFVSTSYLGFPGRPQPQGRQKLETSNQVGCLLCIACLALHCRKEENCIFPSWYQYGYRYSIGTCTGIVSFVCYPDLSLLAKDRSQKPISVALDWWYGYFVTVLKINKTFRKLPDTYPVPSSCPIYLESFRVPTFSRTQVRLCDLTNFLQESSRYWS
jgi:hypothetical protein